MHGSQVPARAWRSSCLPRVRNGRLRKRRLEPDPPATSLLGDAELIALQIGQHRPFDAELVARVVAGRPQADEASDLGLAVGRVEVEVHAVLARTAR